MYANRWSKEFIDGVHYFLRVAEANRQKGFICCPCNKCKNQKEYSASRTIHFHLFESGFMPSYNCWTSHGEQGVEMEEDEVEDDNIPDFAQYAGFEGMLMVTTLRMILVRCCRPPRRIAKVKRGPINWTRC